VVIPSDPLEAYYKAGYDKKILEDYYNPTKLFDEVFLLSPYEKRKRNELGLQIIPTKPKQLKKLLKELDIDIVRAYGGYWACDMACSNKVEGIPVVVSVHDTNPRILYNSIKKADYVFCVSNAVKKLVLTKFKNPEHVWLLPNRVDFNIMRPYAAKELSDLNEKYNSKYRILFVGRKHKQKNLDTLIKSLKFLGKDYSVLAIGRGNSEQYINLAKKEGVLEQLHLLDAIQFKELARYYSFTECMCTPSRWEGFGMVFIEALACSSAVVTSDIAPMNEFIEHMQNGLLVKDFENPEAIANMIQIACTNQPIRAKIKKTARNSVLRFEKSQIDKLEASLYNKILSLI